MWGIRGVMGRWGWDVESPHILADSFRANKNVGSPGAKMESVVGVGRQEPTEV